MSTKVIFAKEYEDFLLTGDENVCNSLPNGSKEKEFFELTRLLLKTDYTKNIEKKIEKFFENYHIPEEQSIRLKALLIFKKVQKNPNKTEEIIKDIKDLFNYGSVTSHSKPMKYNKLVKEENEEKKIKNKLNLEKYIKIYQLVDDIYKGKIIPNDDTVIDILGSSDIQYRFDINKIPIDTLVEMILNKDDFPEMEINTKIAMNIDNFKKLLKILNDRCIEDDKLEKEVESFFEKYYSHFSNEHIEEILKYDKFNFSFLIKKLFQQMSLSVSQTNVENQVKELKQLKTVLSKYKNTKEYIQYVLLSILDFNMQLNIYEFDTFIEYIKLPLNSDESFYNKSSEKTKKLGVFFDEDIITNIKKKERKLVEKYIKHFYLNEKIPFDKLNKYFNENYIKKFYSKMQIYLGNEIPTKDKILSSIEINELMNEIILNINDYNNKKTFSITEEVEIFVEIKNISQLYINIYEINTENYYYTNKKEFDNNISLDGITPTFEDKYSFNEKPQLLLEKKISISKIPKKRGLFVVEFIGSGHVSRAVIQRGDLKIIDKNTPNGKVVYILDEENNILKGDKTGLWINNIWYNSIKDTGAILIPYSVKGNYCILKHDDFCVLENDFKIPDESYNLDGQFIINEESFIMGNVSKILFKPYLYVCAEICPLEKLKDVKLTINTIKTENNQNIPSMNIIDNIKLSYDKEFSFDFQVPPKLKSVQFILSGKINYMSINKEENLSFSKTYEFTRDYEYDTLIKKNDEGNYLIHFLGKNGEPKINHSVNLNINHVFQKKLNDGKAILLESDSEGVINLGNLKDVNSIKLDKQTVININQMPKHSYYEKMTILEGEEISIPFKGSDNIYLINAINHVNMTKLLKIKITDEKNNLGNIALPKLTKGKYNLFINKQKILVKVIKGNKLI